MLTVQPEQTLKLQSVLDLVQTLCSAAISNQTRLTFPHAIGNGRTHGICLMKSFLSLLYLLFPEKKCFWCTQGKKIENCIEHSAKSIITLYPHLWTAVCEKNGAESRGLNQYNMKIFSFHFHKAFVYKEPSQKATIFLFPPPFFHFPDWVSTRYQSNFPFIIHWTALKSFFHVGEGIQDHFKSWNTTTSW